MDLQDAIKTIFEGNSVLFTGAGFSLSATNMNNVNFKSAYSLAETLYKECDEINDGDLENAVDIFLDQYGEMKLIEYLKNEFTVRSIPDDLKVFGSVNWKRIYTTNYDNVVETAYHSSGKVLSAVTLSDRAIDYDKQHICVHLNGDITKLNQNTLNNEFKLTNVSYLTQAFLESEWLNLFTMDLATADSVFFVGFSLKYDLDIKRLIYANPELKRKTFFIVSKEENPNNIKLMSKFGIPVPIVVDEFAQKIIYEKKVYIAPITKFEHYFSFRKVQVESKKLLPKVKDNDIRSLYVDGIFDDYLLQYSLQLPKEYPYYVHRNKFENIIDKIESGQKNFVLHSDMGNGKSMFLEGLKHFLHKKGYIVYQYYKFYSPIYRELEKICAESNEKTVLIVDNYTTDWQLLDVLKLHRRDLIFITTERTLVFDVTCDRLESIIGDYILYDINCLDSEEIDSIIDIFSKYGFWQDFSGKPHFIKRKFIEETCKREFRTLLLKLLDSPDILHRFEKIITDIKGKKGYYNAFIFILISNVYGFDLDLENLAYTLGYDVINNSSFVKNQHIREFINLERGTITIKSPILSSIILSKVVDSVVLVDTILSVFTKLDKHHNQRPYKNILRSFVSFSNLQRILDKTDRSYKYNMLRFFEGIRNTNFCRENPHFWLQYAIEKLSERDYTSANQYFKTAYSYANNRAGYDTYQIDNHYARYILEFSIESGNKDECLDDFRKAHSILMDPLHEKVVKYYPFRVAQNYLPFYEKFYADFDEAQKRIFFKACEEILEKIERYVRNVPKYSKSKDVITARTNFNFILSQSSN